MIAQPRTQPLRLQRLTYLRTSRQGRTEGRSVTVPYGQAHRDLDELRNLADARGATIHDAVIEDVKEDRPCLPR